MTHIDDVLDPADLGQALDEQLITCRRHPTLPFVIYNYTDAATYGRRWTPATRTCRGLIVDTDTGEVVARPWRKFWNLGESGAYAPDPGEPVRVYEKVDGSFGIGYPTPDGGYALATRGAFTSAQAVHATALWQERYAAVEVPAGLTPLFEIIYPENQIVVDYDGQDDLVLLGAVDIATGRSVPLVAAELLLRWPGPVVERHAFLSVGDAAAAASRSNREGYVLHFPRTDERVKIKHAEYVMMHRTLADLTSRRLWEYLAVTHCVDNAEVGKREAGPVDFLVRKLYMSHADVRGVLDAGGGWYDDLLDRVPDTYRPWVRDEVTRLATARNAAMMVLRAAYARALRAAGPGRRGFIAAARGESPQHWRALLRIHDGQQIETWLWRHIRPGFTRPGFTTGGAE